MKSVFFLITLFVGYAVCAQHPLVGTWEMISIKGINAEGERFSFDTTQVREIKIITPTHYMLIAHNVEGDTLTFNRCYAGTFRLEGTAYIETPIASSLPIFDNVRSSFIWRVANGNFIQSGTFTRPDGKTVVLEEMVFRKVSTPNAYPANPAIGFWQLLSSEYTGSDGSKGTMDDETRYHVITPTHWMRISHVDGEFQHAMGGTYSLKNGKTYPSIDFSSVPPGLPLSIEVTDTVKGDKLHASATVKDEQGHTSYLNDVFQRK